MLERHHEQAVAAVQRAVRGATDAEDCVQEATMRLAWRDDLDPTRVRALLTRAAVHIAIDRLRSRKREERALARLGADLTGRTISPEDVVADRAEVERLLAAIDTLPRRERQVMRMRLSGLSVLETAKALGLSHKSVEGMYTRARARVRLMLGAVLAWVAGRLRRAPSPQAEVLVAAAAILFFAGPLWQSGPATSPARPGHPGPRSSNTAAVAAGPRGDGSAAAGRGAAHPGADRSDDFGSPAGGSGAADHHQPTIFSTGPVSVPEPSGGSGQPPLIYFGGISVIGPITTDPVTAYEQCLAQGGPTISLYYGGCNT